MKPDSAIKITTEAANQVKKSAEESVHKGWPLRIAVRKDENNNFHYAMGFDDKSNEDDISFKSEGVEIVVSATHLTLMKGMEIDYVELEKGSKSFIFANPNDPNYVAPKE